MGKEMKRIGLLLLIMAMTATSGLQAQITKQEAKNIIAEMVSDRIDSVNVYMEPYLQTDSYYNLSLYDSIAVTYNSYWMFFIDEEPQYLWGHRCTYVFIDENNGSYISVEKQLPPFQYGLFLEDVYISFDYELSSVLDLTSNTDSLYVPTPNADVNDGKYAVLFCGGDNLDLTPMWNALSHSYCSLIENGYMKENIYVLSCDGSTGSGSNLKMDLDNDSVPDILPIVCNSSNLDSIFNHLSLIITESDILYVFVTTHGNNNTVPRSNDVSFMLWNDEPLDDDDFASMLERINCSQMIINLYSCFAGGFVQELLDMNNNSRKTILTCIDGLRPYLRRHPELKIDVYNYFACSALRGGYPALNEPWYSPYTIGNNPDFYSLFGKPEINFDLQENGGNNNGLHEINEVIEFVSEYDFCFNNWGYKIYDFGFKDDLLSLRGITGKVVTTDTVQGNYHIEDVLSVEQNTDLYVNNANLYLYDAEIHIDTLSGLHFENNVSIIAKNDTCRLIIDGGMTFGKKVKFVAEEGAEMEIIVNTDNFSFNNVTFNNCKLTLTKSHISFSNCEFIDTPVAFESYSERVDSSSIVISNCNFNVNNDTMNYAINIHNVQSYNINNCTIDGEGDNGTIRNGIQVYYCGNSASATMKNISNNTIENCNNAGLLVYASTGNITMNRISNNKMGVELLNNCNISNFNGNCAATNSSETQYIHGNDLYEVYMSSACNPQIFRYNIIEDNDSIPYLYYDGTIGFASSVQIPVRGQIDVTYNNWGSNFDADQHLFSNVTATEYLFYPEWELGDCSNATDSAKIIIARADSLVSEEKYEEAKTLYMQVVSDYPTTTSAETALKTMLPLEYYVENDYEGLQQYYLEEEEIVNDSVLLPLAKSLANKCDEEMGNYTDAINWYEGVITNPESTYNDSIFATIDLGNLYLKMEDNGAKGIRGKMTEYIPKTSKAYQEQRDYALTLLPKDRSTQEETSLANMVKEGAEYCTLLENYNGFLIHRTETITFEGEIEIEGVKYNQTFRKFSSDPGTENAELIGYMREEENGKVFFRELYSDNEILVYDFGMAVGDSVRMYWNQYDTSEVYVRLDSVSSIYLNGNERRCYYVSSKDAKEANKWQYTYRWIEGIGALEGFLYPSVIYQAGGAPTTTLLCAKYFDETIYMNEEYGTCFIDNTTDLVKENVEYNTFIYNYFGYIEPIKTLTTKFEGYTTIGENEYMNVYQKDTSTTNEYELIGYMREEDNGKVYFYDNDKEYLLYDFGMKVGDSIKIYWQQCYECETYIRLDSITEEEIGGAIRKCYHTSSNEFGFWGAPVVWVEGIGSLDGLFYPESMTAPGGYITTLLCYKEKGELVYMNEEFDDCIIGNTLSEEEVMTGTSISKVYPNPGENILNIRTALPEGRIEVYDILGKVIYKQDITEEVTKIPTEGWAKGMYLWRVYSEGKEAESGKWVKQ